MYVGYSGTGSFTQSGGINTLSNGDLDVGYWSGSSGTYNLSGTGQLSVGPYFSEYVGYYGTGNFTQSGGTNVISRELWLGDTPGSSGTYSLSGSGMSSVPYEEVGFQGTGNFIQSGGTNVLSGAVYLGYGSSGTYSLSGTGLLSASEEDVGYTSTGTFTQSGGTNTISGGLYLGDGSSSSGTYTLNGSLASLSGGYEEIPGILRQGLFHRSPAGPTRSPPPLSRLQFRRQRNVQP